jgi:hypothetical protein
MQELSPLDPWAQELERSLRSLAPATGELSLREAWYRGGLLAARRRVRLWRTAAAAMLFVASGLMLARSRPQPLTVERVVYVPRPTAQVGVVLNTSSPRLLPPSYLALRDAVENDGWRALGSTADQGGIGGAAGQTPVRPIDEASPVFWAITQDRG